MLSRVGADAGTVPNLKFSYAQSRNRVLSGCWAREITTRELPVATDIAGVNKRLSPRVSVAGDERRFSAEPRALIGLVHGTSGNVRGTAEAEDHAGEDGEG